MIEVKADFGDGKETFVANVYHKNIEMALSISDHICAIPEMTKAIEAYMALKNMHHSLAEDFDVKSKEVERLMIEAYKKLSLDTQPIADIMGDAIDKINAPTIEQINKDNISLGDYCQEVIKILKEDFNWSHSPDMPFIKQDYDSGKTVIQSCENFGYWDNDNDTWI
jgi:hypothetical protein